MISRFTKQLKGAVVLGALLVGSNAFAQLGLNWAEMGPNDIAGRCRSIIVDKTDASGNKMFAAGVSGGVFKSSNAGATWTQVNDQAQSLIVSCMAQDATGNIYFGTGEAFGRGGNGAGLSGFIGTGLYMIASNSSVTTLVKDSSVFGDINEVAVIAPNTIYVAGQKGLFYSTDGGTTFVEEALSITANVPAMDVKVTSTGDVYYSGGSKTSSTSAVYYAPTGSFVFTAITPTTIANRGRIEIAPSPVDPNYVYLSIAKQKAVPTSTAFGASGGLSAVLVSNNKGSSWSLISLGTAQFDPLSTATAKGMGDYSNTIVADPIYADACYLGSDVFYSWKQIASNPLGQGNWTQIGTNFPIPFAIYIHSNVHAVTFNSGNGSMYIATDGGIFKSVSNNTGFLAYNSGLNIAQFNSVSFSSFPRVTSTVNIPYAGVAGGTIGNSLTYLPGNLLNGVQASNSFGTTDAFQSDFSSISPKVLFYSGVSGSILRSSDIDITAPSTFYDNSYKGAVGSSVGSPGSSAFANENTPMRLWENNNGTENGIFYNGIITTKLNNTSTTAKTFTFINARPQVTGKYDSIFVKTASSKKAFKPLAVTQTFTNSNTTAATFTINNTRTNTISKYDSVVVKMTSFKKSTVTPVITTYTNNDNTASSFTLTNIRPSLTSCKYDTIKIWTTSTKSLSPPLSQTIIIRPTYSLSNIVGYSISGGPTGTNNIVYVDNVGFNDSIRYTFANAPKDSSIFNIRIKYKYDQTIYMVPAYTGSLLTNVNVTGEADNTPITNNTVTLNNTTLTDNIQFTFTDPPNDSSVISVRTKNDFYQTMKMITAYTGTAITGYTIIGEANNTPTTNCKVILNNSTLLDTVRFTFRTAPEDSSVITSDVKLRYNAGDIITLKNTDISGGYFSAPLTLTTALYATNTQSSVVYVPLKKSARLATGTSASSNANSGNSPSIYIVKRPLNFGINPDWIKVAGQYSRVDSAGGTPFLATPSSTIAVPILGTSVTRLEWAPDGASIYFSTKLNDTTFYLYRTSHLQFVGDSAAEDYSGAFSSDLDSTYRNTPTTFATTRRKGVSQRTTPIGMFKYPITGIAVSADNMNVMITMGGYTNTAGNVWYSNSDARALNLNNTDASNFTMKNGTGLPSSPVYTGIFEMNDNKRAIVGAENGVYSTMDITQPSPTWVKESGGNFPNVPVFQIRQQTIPSYKCYNSGIIYAATHGRGIWSTDKYFTPYAIGVEEQETVFNSNTNIKVFPNPANDAANLWFKANGDAKYSVTVYDINGRVLIQQTTGKLMEGEQKLTLNTSELTAGIYFVTVSGTNNFNANSKLVITH